MLFAQLPDFAITSTFFWIALTGLVLLLVKVCVLIWAYAKTHRLAVLVYALYVIVQSTTPMFLTRLLSIEQFTYFSMGISFLEIPLFAWMIVALAGRFRPSATPPRDISNDG
ncbi:MAG: hypothetical protein AAFP20_08730 [Cyanobacteria bacterium J06614_10]